MGAPLSMLFLLLVAGLVGLASGLVLLSQRKPLVTEPSCGKCGYCVKGVPTFICPECGTDLRECGIVTARFRRAYLQSPFKRVSVWTALLLMLALTVTSIVAEVVPPVIRRKVTLMYFTGPSRAYYKAELICQGESYQPPTPLDTLDVAITLNSGKQVSAPYFASTAKKGAATNTDATPQFGTDWLRSVGLDIDAPAVAAEANELLRLCQEYVAGQTVPTSSITSRLLERTGSSAAATSTPPSWFYPAAAALWLAVWLLGAWRLVRRHHVGD